MYENENFVNNEYEFKDFIIKREGIFFFIGFFVLKFIIIITERLLYTPGCTVHP